MKATFRQSMAWLHTWCGLLAGWLLFAVFLTGTVSYFRPELSQWMRPELHPAGGVEQAVRLAVDRLQAVAPAARRWLIEPPTARDPGIQIVFWNDAGRTPGFGRELLDPATGLPAAVRETHGGDSLYYFHFDLLLPSVWGRLLVGFAAVAMLVAIVSGVVTHRRIFADFFTFRPRKGQRSWLDAHNACGVLVLPYHLVITYSGIVTLMFLYLPWGLDAAYRDGSAAFHAESGMALAPPPRSGRAAPLADVSRILGAAEAEWQGTAGRIDIHRPGDSAARIVVWRSDQELMAFRGQRLVFDGTTGAPVADAAVRGPALATRNILYGLHIARFADPVLRWLLFASGVAGTAMIGSGLVLWTVKRRPRHAAAGPGLRVADALNVAVIAGLPSAIALHLWANRLLPSGLAGRADLEVQALFAAWSLAALHAMLRPPERAWPEQLAAAAVLLAGLPVLNAVTTPRHLAASLAAGDWAVAGVDLGALAAGVCCAAAALAITRRRAKATAR